MGLQANVAASYSANSYVYFVLAASVIELIAAALHCQNRDYWYSPNQNYWADCTQYNGWAVAVGAISTGLCLIFAICTCWPASFTSRAAPFFAAFLVILWIPGAFVTTFNEPFATAGNGYYAAWAAFFFSLLFCQQVGLANFSAYSHSGAPDHDKAIPMTSTSHV